VKGHLFAAFLAAVAVACGPPTAGAPEPLVTPSVPAPAAAQASPATPASLAVPAALPNHNLTPGEVFAGVTAAQVCVSGYAKAVRSVSREQYVTVYAEYGVPYPEPAGSYELDHLVSGAPISLVGNCEFGNSQRYAAGMLLGSVG